ncbi:DUF3159 domain-containing protein [Nonomuraea dietziae]|uniref:DUF3159 domain-containing protein n=1 Tax=Nonomuraea dietziae TaxID=65515 RepID=UPI00340F7318
MKGDLLLSSLPVAVFVMVEAAAGLTAGVCCALGAALALTVARAVRRQPLRPAIGAFIGVAIASFIAYRTGGAGGYFLAGIWWSLACCCVLLLSMVVRRPLVGVVWSVMNRAPPAWRADRPSVTGYDLATGALAAVFAARFVVQRWLYTEDQTGWLAVAKVVMGYPLWAFALAVAFWAVRRSERRLAVTRRRVTGQDERINP